MKERYFSFLLRIWGTGVPDNPVWRISLENTMTREMMGFDSTQEMVEHLSRIMAEGSDQIHASHDDKLANNER